MWQLFFGGGHPTYGVQVYDQEGNRKCLNTNCKDERVYDQTQYLSLHVSTCWLTFSLVSNSMQMFIVSLDCCQFWFIEFYWLKHTMQMSNHNLDSNSLMPSLLSFIIAFFLHIVDHSVVFVALYAPDLVWYLNSLCYILLRSVYRDGVTKSVRM